MSRKTVSAVIGSLLVAGFALCVETPEQAEYGPNHRAGAGWDGRRVPGP